MNRTHNAAMIYLSFFLCLTVLSACGKTAPSGEIFPEMTAAADKAEQAAEETEESSYSRQKLLDVAFYDEDTFELHERTAPLYETDGKIIGGVVTHHLLAGEMTAGFFRTAAARGDDIDTVVITAPMHYPQDKALCTVLSDWQTPCGTAQTDTELAERFISYLGAQENDGMLTADHSASSLIPYVKYYLPGAKVACLLVSGRADKNVSEKIASLLADVSEEKNCLFVFSIDFSHYLSPHEAEKMDAVTREAVMTRDIEGISRMTDSNMDSPRCMCAFLELMDALGGNVSELDHNNSLGMTSLPYNEVAFPEGVTSYFVFAGTIN